MSNLHRIQWIDAQIRIRRYPNCSEISERFCISVRQASRDIEYLRYSMGAPVEYSTENNGYYYIDETFILPAQLISEDERSALSFLAEQYRKTGNTTAQKLADLFSRIIFKYPEENQPGIPVSVIDIPSVEMKTYELLRTAADKFIKISMIYNNARGEQSRRIFCPYNLFSKNRVYYVVGYCEIKQEIRVFRLSRILKLKHTNQGFTPVSYFDTDRLGKAMRFDFRDPYIAKVRFDRPVNLNRFDLKTDLDSDSICEIKFYNSNKLVGKLLTLPTGFTIIFPSWLRVRMKEKMEKILKKHSL